MFSFIGMVFFMTLAKVIYIFSTAYQVKTLGKYGVPIGSMLAFGVVMIIPFYIAGMAKWTGHNLAFKWTNWWGMSATYEFINLSVILLAGLFFFNKPQGFNQYAGLVMVFLGAVLFKIKG